MAMMRFICCFCQAPFDIDDREHGRSVRCPGCRRELTVPAATPAQSSVLQSTHVPSMQSSGVTRQVRSTAAPSVGQRGLQLFIRLPLSAQFVTVGMLCFIFGTLLGSGYTGLRRYSAEAHQNVVARAERVENELAALKERQKASQADTATATGVQLQSRPQSPQSVKPVEAAGPAREALDGDVTLSVDFDELPDGRVRLHGATNLPAETRLMLSVEERLEGGFIGESKCSVAADGTFTSNAFGPPSGLKAGRYVAEVVMPFPRFQPESVKKIIDLFNEHLGQAEAAYRFVNGVIKIVKHAHEFIIVNQRKFAAMVANQAVALARKGRLFTVYI